MSETAVLFILGQALVGAGLVVSAAIWISRKIATLSANQDASRELNQLGFSRIEQGVKNLDDRHVAMQSQVHGLSRVCERHSAILESHSDDIAELKRRRGA